MTEPRMRIRYKPFSRLALRRYDCLHMPPLGHRGRWYDYECFGGSISPFGYVPRRP